MGWFKRRKEKKESIENIKPKSSYDLYNNSETQDLHTQSSILVAYDENKNENPTPQPPQQQKSSTKSKTRTTTVSNSRRNIYYVSARKDKDGKKIGWEVKKEKASKITKLCATKEEAIQLVKSLCGNQGATCIIRKLDGSIQETFKFDKDDK